MDRRRIDELGREYDELIREKLPEVIAYIASRREHLESHELDVEDFHLPLRPMFYSRDDLGRIEQAVHHLWGGLLDVYHHVFGDDPEKAAHFLGTPKLLLPWLRRCFSAERDVSELIGRPDGFCWGDEIRFIEQNTSSSAGGATIDTVVEFFDGFPALEALRAHTPVQKLSLFDAYATWFTHRYQGRGIGYMDAFSLETGERWDMQGVRFVDGLRARGIELKYLAYRQVEFRGDGPYFEGERLRCLYRGFAAVGIEPQDLDDMAPFFEACGRGEVRMVTSPYEIIFFDKRLLPYLSDDTLNTFLSDERRAALSRTLPWTRFLRDYDTFYRGERVNVPALCLERKDAFVLKKGDGCASMAVAIGADCDEAAWRDHVARNLADGGWVVQELVDAPTERLAYLHGTDLVFADVVTMTCPFVIEGHIAAIVGRTAIPRSGSRILASAGRKLSVAGIRTAFCVG